jgi:hypothetical protein
VAGAKLNQMELRLGGWIEEGWGNTAVSSTFTALTGAWDWTGPGAAAIQPQDTELLEIMEWS